MIKEGSLCLAIIPIDIEQWRTGIEILNGCCQYSTARFELSIYNIFSMNVMFAFMFLLILLCISSFKIIFHFLLPSFLLSFFFGTVIMQNRSTILNHSAYLSTNFIYMYVIYCEFFNVLHFGYILHPLLLHHEGIEKNSGQQSGEKIIPHNANGTMIVL